MGTTNVCNIFTNGGNIHSGASSNRYIVRPTLYLTHDTKISGGDGTYENPYTIAIQ